MSAVERRGAVAPPWKKQDPRARLRPGRALRASLGSGSAHREPVFLSFVTKAVLWERGVSRHPVHLRPVHPPSLCPRFLSHMKARPEDFHPPRLASSASRQRPPSLETMPSLHALPVARTRLPEGQNQPSDLGGTRSVNVGSIPGRRSAVLRHRLSPPAPASSSNPTPPHGNAPRPGSGRQQWESNRLPASLPCLSPPPIPPSSPRDTFEAPDWEVGRPAASVHLDLDLLTAGSTPPASPSCFSVGSGSDFSRPASSSFSRRSDLSSGRSSVLRGRTPDILSSSPPRPPPARPLPPLSPPLSPLPPEPTHLKTLTPLPTPPLLPEPHSPRPAPAEPLTRRSREEEEPPHGDAGSGPGLRLSLESDPGPATPVLPSTSWSSCPSPQWSARGSGSLAPPTPSPPASRLESHRWPVLPPISPFRGSSAASRCSELSCSHSRVFDELEAIAPPSPSGLSLDEPSDSSGRPSPDTDPSPGLAALTAGCDSGNLGSLSRVQLLLLDRTGPLQSPPGVDEELEDWPEGLGVLRPLTAGSVSERCDSAGKVQGNKSEESEGSSPSSWIIDRSPSLAMFRSPRSPSPGSHTDAGGPTEEESPHAQWRDREEASLGDRRPESPGHKTQEKERRMEERKTKVLKMLSKLQDETPGQSNGSKGHANFEDFDFLAKYCIFSQEKLAEYKRAFEAEDVDGDGYLSCLQVLLALKNIIPPELLSDEEEIYVYRILEMVDFRVTDGLVDLRLFAVIASLAQRIASMDEFMRSLVSSMDFRSLEVRLFKAKQLFLFLLEEQRGDEAPASERRGLIGAEQLLLELKAGGVRLEREAAVRQQLRGVPPLDLLGFLAYLPLFMLVHKSVISDPLADATDL